MRLTKSFFPCCCLPDSALLLLSLCLDFPPASILPCPRPKQFYLPTNESNTCSQSPEDIPQQGPIQIAVSDMVSEKPLMLPETRRQEEPCTHQTWRLDSNPLFFFTKSIFVSVESLKPRSHPIAQTGLEPTRVVLLPQPPKCGEHSTRHDSKPVFAFVDYVTILFAN